MATSRLARLFGRKDREADTAPPAYTGIGAPRQYEPPPGAPGHGTAGYQQQRPAATTYVPARPGPPAPGGPPSAPAPRPPYSPQEQAPVVTRARYDEAARQRRAADQQVEILERQDAKLTAQIHAATEQERHDYVRELVSRRIAVRSRLEESTLRRNRLRQTEDELGAGLATYDAPGGRRF